MVSGTLRAALVKTLMRVQHPAGLEAVYRVCLKTRTAGVALKSAVRVADGSGTLQTLLAEVVRQSGCVALDQIGLTMFRRDVTAD